MGKLNMWEFESIELRKFEVHLIENFGFELFEMRISEDSLIRYSFNIKGIRNTKGTPYSLRLLNDHVKETLWNLLEFN